MKRYIKILSLISLITLSFNGWGQLLQWNTFGNTGTETTEPSVANDANITAANLTQGTITPAGNTNRFGGTGWFNTGNTVAGNTLAEAVAGNDYIQFIVTPNSGYNFTPTSFVFQWDKSGTGPSKVTLRSSADGYTTDLGTINPVAAIGTSNTITITGLTALTTATTFRLYGYGATATGGTGGFDVGSNIVNVQLNGTTAAISSNDATSKVEVPASQISLGDITSIATASGSAVSVFSFKVRDLGTSDGLATKVTQVKIKKSSGTADWTDHIAGATLWNGATQITTGTVTITDADIAFPITAGNLDIANNNNVDLTLKIWLNTSNIVDNATMVFTVSQTTHGFTADVTGSTFATDFGATVTGNTMTIRVTATKLLFVQQPINTIVNVAMATNPTVKATDANNNTDLDYSTAVSVTSTGTLTGSPVSGTWASNIATFASLTHTVVQTGRTLTASSGTLTNAISNTFDITAASVACASDLIISEYVEGTSNNKAIEIFNNTGASVNLANYSLKKQTNGAGLFADELVLSGTLSDGATYVIVNSSSSAALLALGNLSTASACMSFNGNDAVALYKSGVQIDVVGVVNQVANWGADVTLVRKSTIVSPTTTYALTDWDSYAVDIFTNLGSHTMSCGTPDILLSSSNPAVAAANIAQGSTKQPIYKFTLAVTTASAILNTVSFITTNSAATDITKYQLWYKTTDDLSTATQIGSDIILTLGTGTHTFSGLTQSIASGVTGYLWITVDVSATATVNNTLNVSTAISTANLTFVSGNKSGTAYTGGIQTIIAPTPLIALSDNGTQVAAANVGQGTIAHVLHKFKLSVTVVNTSLTGISCTTAGTYIGSDITNIKVRYSTDAILDGADVTLSTFTNPGVAGIKTFPAFTSQTINAASIGYIFITADIAAAATPGNNISVNAITTSNLTFSSGTKSGSTSIGGAQTFTVSCASELFISEYCEGSSNNKYLEIYNGTGVGVNLSNYRIGLYTNGSGAITAIPLTATTLADGASWVLAYNAAITPAPDAIILTAADQTTTNAWNGDDALVLQKNTGSWVNIDIIGVVGVDPGSGWDVAGITTATANHTLIRKSSIKLPQTSWVTSSGTDASNSEWEVQAEDYFDNIGIHTIECACIEPTVNALNLTFPIITGTTMDLAWTSGNGLKRIIVACEGSPVSWSPIDGNTYSANSDFSLATDLGLGNKIVYSGNGNSFTLSGLNTGTTYYFKIYEYNCSIGSENYFISGTLLTGNATTIIENVTNFRITCITNTSATLTWDQMTGNYGGVLITVRNAGIPSNPTCNGSTLTTPNTIFTSAPIYCGNATSSKYVYNGTGTTVTITGLTAGQSYTFKAFTYQGASWTTGTLTTDNANVQNVTAVNTTSLNAQIRLTWANPTSCYDEILVLAHSGGAVTQTPSGNGSTYTANSTFGLGTNLGSNDYVVYKGVSTLIDVIGLTNGIQYCFTIFTRKGTEWSTGVSVCETPANVTTFLPGELVIVGFDASMNGGSDDAMYISNFVDIKPGTKFQYLNSRFEAGAVANERTLHWGGSGDEPYDDPAIVEFTWNGLFNLPAGSIISFETSGIALTVINNIKINGVLSSDMVGVGIQGNCNVSASEGDQIWIVQGTFSSYGTVSVDRYSLLNGNVIYGLTSRLPWVPITNAVSDNNITTSTNPGRESRVHPDLECFNLELLGTTDYAYYKNGTGGNPGTPIHTGTKRNLLLSIMTAANWVKGAGDVTLNFTEQFKGCEDVGTDIRIGRQFCFIAGNSVGTWVGSTDVDWFNCRNWEGLTVPDSTTNVTIPNVTNSPDIDATSINAPKHNFIAECMDIDINNETLNINGSSADSLFISGNLLIQNSGSLNMDDGSADEDGIVYLRGNWNNQATFNEGDGTIVFSGTTQQTITTSAGTENYNKLFLNNTFLNGVLTYDNIVIEKDFIQTDNTLDLNGNNIEIQGPYTNSNSYFIGDVVSDFTINGSGLIGDLYFRNDINLSDFTIDRVGQGTNLGSNLNIVNTINMTNGIVNTGAFTIDMGLTGSIFETPVNPTSYVLGNLKATRNIGGGANQLFGGMGLEINTASALNSTVVTRVTGIQLPGNSPCCSSNLSIKRYFDIVPTTNTLLNATLKFHYFDVELMSVSEANLRFYKAPLPFLPNTWVEQPIATSRDLPNNFLTLASIPSFSRWTVASGTAPLPVELIKFTGTLNNKIVNLFWQTASETNNDYFEVFKSKDLSYFEKLGTVAGAGNSNSINVYSFIDENPYTGNNYYKLKQVDFDGNFSESNNILVQFQNAGNINVYYNNENNIVVSNSSNKIDNIEITDVTGKIITSLINNSEESQIQINVGNITPGIYFVKVICNNETTVRKIFIE